MLLNCGVGEGSWESLGLQRDPTSPSKRKTVLDVHWKDWCWSWNSNIWAIWCKELTHWKRPWCWERLRAGGEGDNRGWVGWMASLTQMMWVWVNSRSWWWTGRPGVLQSVGLQRVRHDWATKLNWTGQGSNPSPLHWEHGVLATGPPVKSLSVLTLVALFAVFRASKFWFILFLAFTIWMPACLCPLADDASSSWHWMWASSLTLCYFLTSLSLRGSLRCSSIFWPWCFPLRFISSPLSASWVYFLQPAMVESLKSALAFLSPLSPNQMSHSFSLLIHLFRLAGVQSSGLWVSLSLSLSFFF